MTESNNEPSQVTSSWDAYWQGTGEAGAFSCGGASHPAILALWNGFFTQVKQNYDSPAMLDIASGNGAVIEHALQVFDESEIEIRCVDISRAAIANIQNRFKSVHGLTADARSIPMQTASFDIVTSQFGVEYAGIEAILEAVRLLASGGQLGLLMHCQQGAIHNECVVNLEAVNRVRDCGFLEGATRMFRAGFEAVRGADRRPYDDAAKRLAPAVAEVEAILSQLGERVADDTIARLYGDVARIHAEIQHYDPDEVLTWLAKMDTELETYAGRMFSMTDAAINEADFNSLCSNISASDELLIDQAGPLLAPGNELPLAWVVLAHKPNA